MEENPFQSPQALSGEPAGSTGGGLARQIPVVAILLMVQGALELLVGGFFLFFGGTVALFAKQEAVQQGMIFGGVSTAMGASGVLAGALHAIAGWQNYFYRRRSLGIVALVTGLGSLFTCYCFPTALLLMGYGLIVYCSAQSAWAFAAAQQGMSREQIWTALNT
ncbi:MAG TPA: hypothetical protein VHC22_11485 [Pirellulales bacterium]|nr:hypothetical protein [Pirellulales bacterium]